MDTLFKGFRKNRQKTNKHEKLAERWGELNEPVKEGVVFHVNYLGSTLVEELDEEGQSYGDSISAEAVKTIVAMAKASGKKLPKMTINISPNGIKVINAETKSVWTDLCIYRICFCTADKDHEKVFAYIARNTENETMECHAFLSTKRKIAQAVTLTIAQAFTLAKEEFEVKEIKERENQEKKAFESNNASMNKDLQSMKAEEPVLGFEDNFADMDLSLAQSKVKSEANPFRQSGFTTGLLDSDLDAELTNILKQTSEQRSSEMNRTPSVDDLLLL